MDRVVTSLFLCSVGVKDGAKIYVTVSGNGRLKNRMNSASVGSLNAMNAVNKPDPLMGPLLKVRGGMVVEKSTNDSFNIIYHLVLTHRSIISPFLIALPVLG